MGDIFIFLWALLGSIMLFFTGILRFSRQPRDRRAAVNDIISWTSRFFAPAPEKVQDYIIATHLFNEYFQNGPLLDIGFGAGRFEEHALKKAIDSSAAIDGIDIEAELESSLAAFKGKKWVRNAWNRSFNDTGIESETYNYLFSNNALMASSDLQVTLDELYRIAKPEAILQFNLLTTKHCKMIYIAPIIFFKFVGMRKKAQEWEEFSRKRVKNYIDPQQTLVLLENSGWKVIKIIPYGSNFLSKCNFVFYYPAYHWFWPYETGGMPKPFYYPVMHCILRYFLKLMLPMFIAGKIQSSSLSDASKIYYIAKKEPSPL